MTHPHPTRPRRSRNPNGRARKRIRSAARAGIVAAVYVLECGRDATPPPLMLRHAPACAWPQVPIIRNPKITPHCVRLRVLPARVTATPTAPVGA